MKTAEFNRNAGADKESQNEIALTADEKIYLTADGEQFDNSREYFFFDGWSNGVKSSRGLRQAGDYLALTVAIATLRGSREDALADGIEALKSELERIYGALDELLLWDVIDDLTDQRTNEK